MRCKPTARGFGCGSGTASVADLNLQSSNCRNWRAKPQQEFGCSHLPRWERRDSTLLPTGIHPGRQSTQNTRPVGVLCRLEQFCTCGYCARTVSTSSWVRVLYASVIPTPAILVSVPLPQFQPMPLSHARAPFSHPDWIFEIKWDGFLSLLCSDKDGVCGSSST